jgi:hypothetical protein
LIEKLPVLAGSAAVILLMVGVAAALGFRPTAQLDEATLAQLAEADGAAVEAVVFDAKGKAAVARLSGGKLLVARVMGADISSRISPISAARVRNQGGRVSVQFADIGYPPLNLKLDRPPAWLADLCAGDAR